MNYSKLNELTLQGLRELNNQVVAEIRHRQSVEEFAKARQFHVGQAVKFQSPKFGGWITIEINRINAKTVSGVALLEGKRTSKEWRVSPSLLQAA